jgi:AAA+ ATPase superfamily predicted ATPase
MAENIVGPVARGENCFGREEIVKIIWEKLKNGHVLLAAPRRFGKTSIMYRLIDDPRPDFRIIHADLEHMTTPTQLLEELFIRLAKDSKLGGLLHDISVIPSRIWSTVKQNISEVELYKVRLELRESVGTAWQEIGTDLFNKIRQSKEIVLFILDEFPMMIDRMSHSSEHREDAITLLRWLRMIRMNPESNKVRFLVAGSIGIEHVLNRIGEIASINDFEKIQVGPFTSKDADDFLQKLSAKHRLPLSNQGRKKIIDIIGTPVPFFIQILFSELYKSSHLEGEKITPQKIEILYHERVLGVECKSYFDHYYGRLRDYYLPTEERAAKKILRTLAIESTLKRDMCREIYSKETGPNADDDEFIRLMTNLENDFYLQYDGAKAGYVFSSKLLRDWWLRHYALTFQS